MLQPFWGKLQLETKYTGNLRCEREADWETPWCWVLKPGHSHYFFIYIYIFWMLEKEWLSNSNYHSLYLSRYESMQRPPSLIFGHVCEVESVCRGLIERFLVCVAPIQHFQLYKRTQRKIGSLSHQTTQHKHDLWPNQEAFYYITTCH